MTTQARIARRFRVVTNGETFRVQERGLFWWRFVNACQCPKNIWGWDSIDGARDWIRGIKAALEVIARPWVPTKEDKS